MPWDFSHKYQVFHAHILILEIIVMEESDSSGGRDENLRKQLLVALSKIRYAKVSESILI